MHTCKSTMQRTVHVNSIYTQIHAHSRNERRIRLCAWPNYEMKRKKITPKLCIFCRLNYMRNDAIYSIKSRCCVFFSVLLWSTSAITEPTHSLCTFIMKVESSVSIQKSHRHTHASTDRIMLIHVHQKQKQTETCSYAFATTCYHYGEHTRTHTHAHAHNGANTELNSVHSLCAEGIRIYSLFFSYNGGRFTSIITNIVYTPSVNCMDERRKENKTYDEIH